MAHQRSLAKVPLLSMQHNFHVILQIQKLMHWSCLMLLQAEFHEATCSKIEKGLNPLAYNKVRISVCLIAVA